MQPKISESKPQFIRSATSGRIFGATKNKREQTPIYFGVRRAGGSSVQPKISESKPQFIRSATGGRILGATKNKREQTPIYFGVRRAGGSSTPGPEPEFANGFTGPHATAPPGRAEHDLHPRPAPANPRTREPANPRTREPHPRIRLRTHVTDEKINFSRQPTPAPRPTVPSGRRPHRSRWESRRRVSHS